MVGLLARYLYYCFLARSKEVFPVCVSNFLYTILLLLAMCHVKRSFVVSGVVIDKWGPQSVLVSWCVCVCVCVCGMVPDILPLKWGCPFKLGYYAKHFFNRNVLPTPCICFAPLPYCNTRFACQQQDRNIVLLLTSMWNVYNFRYGYPWVSVTH